MGMDGNARELFLLIFFWRFGVLAFLKKGCSELFQTYDGFANARID